MTVHGPSMVTSYPYAPTHSDSSSTMLSAISIQRHARLVFVKAQNGNLVFERFVLKLVEIAKLNVAQKFERKMQAEKIGTIEKCRDTSAATLRRCYRQSLSSCGRKAIKMGKVSKNLGGRATGKQSLNALSGTLCLRSLLRVTLLGRGSLLSGSRTGVAVQVGVLSVALHLTLTLALSLSSTLRSALVLTLALSLVLVPSACRLLLLLLLLLRRRRSGFGVCALALALARTSAVGADSVSVPVDVRVADARLAVSCAALVVVTRLVVAQHDQRCIA